MTRPQRQAETDREAVAWMVRLGSPTLSDDDRRALAAWLSADEANEAALRDARAVWDGLAQPAQMIRVRSASRTSRLRWIRIPLAAAAMLAVPLFLTGRVDLRTAPGVVETVLLEDGSRVTLDGNSAIDMAFDTETRRIELRRGRAFLEVMPDPARPFVAAAAGVEARVLGTAFLISADGSAVEVAVEHGRVAVHGGDGVVELGAGEGITASEGLLATPEAVDPLTALAWRRGLIVIEDRTLIQVATDLDRITGEHLIIPQPAVRDLRLSGVFAGDDPGAVFAAIGTGLGVQMVRIPGVATLVYRRP